MVLKNIFVRYHNMNNRLSIYNDVIYTYLEHSDKVKFRKIAFKNKKTISEFNRLLIKLIIRLDEMNKLNSKQEITADDISSLLNNIGRDIK